MFEAFLAAFPAFAAGVETFRQPAEEFPDVVVRLKDGTEVEVELGEWVAGPQMAAAIRYDRLRDAIIDAIGQGPNLSRHFDAVMLCPRSDAPDFDPADAAAFKAAAVRQGTPIVWGGDWPTLRDGPHFELDRKVFP